MLVSALTCSQEKAEVEKIASRGAYIPECEGAKFAEEQLHYGTGDENDNYLYIYSLIITAITECK